MFRFLKKKLHIVCVKMSHEWMNEWWFIFHVKSATVVWSSAPRLCAAIERKQ